MILYNNFILEFIISALVIQSLQLQSKDGNAHEYIIKKTWNNKTLPDYAQITIKLSTSVEPPSNETQLVFSVDAPFYDDPHIPDDTPNETMWKLWDYEVVELYLLGENEHYIEIQVSPKGQYVLLELRGYRNVIRDKMPLYKNNYKANINPTTERWTGRAVIPNCYLPSNIIKFNAYAIHGVDPNRIYKALFPTPMGKYSDSDPDFHRLEYFETIDFERIFPKRRTHDNGNDNGNNTANPRMIMSNANFVIILLLLVMKIFSA